MTMAENTTSNINNITDTYSTSGATTRTVQHATIKRTKIRQQSITMMMETCSDKRQE
jgi:hypothetical protein